MLELNFSPFPEIVTPRLLLRKPANEDIDEIFFLRSDAETMKYIDKPRAKSKEDAQAFLDMILKSLEANEGISWGIALRDMPNKLIGTIGFWRIKKDHYRAEIGYMLHPGFWRKGLMKEAILAALDFGFNDMNIHSVEANINVENIASASILEATGFVKEAHFKEDFFFEGVFRDTIIYSRLK